MFILSVFTFGWEIILKTDLIWYEFRMREKFILGTIQYMINPSLLVLKSSLSVTINWYLSPFYMDFENKVVQSLLKNV